MSLDGKRILIVGGGSGIGFAVAQAAQAQGAQPLIASTNAEKLATASARLGGCETAQIDITDEAAVGTFFAGSGPFEHIVSTAGDWGKARRGPIADMDLDDARALLDVRFWGAVILAKHGAAHVTQGGSITLTSGMSAFRPQKGSVMATAMAGSIAHLTIGLAVELAPIRVNAVFPGGVATEIFAGLPEAMRKTEEARFASQPIPRIAQPDEVAQAYLYAMKGSYTTGQIIKVDGGGELAG
ncbi:MAG: SDR family oxidoreductase [Rhizobiales bacterium]|nr:SDR family oxidoreductase [Hyphomicrobiales bacterium]